MKTYGDPNADLCLIMEPGSMKSQGAKRLLWETLDQYGFKPEDCFIVYAFPTIPELMQGSDSKEGKWIKEHREEFLEDIGQFKGRLGIAFGKLATRACSNKPVKITKARGQAWEYDDLGFPVLTCYAPNHVLRRPELLDIFESDLFYVQRFADADWDIEELRRTHAEANYEWVTDLQFLIDNPPKALAVDTETTGLDWYRPEVRPLTVQLCWAEGEAVAVPVDMKFWPGMGRRLKAKIVGQLKQILENPGTKCFAHNMAYDHHILMKMGISANWWMDTQIMAFCADDNMQDKSQNECVRRWVPSMAGYADEFDRTVDKSDMINVPKDKFLRYGCGDADALFRLCKTLTSLCRKDERQWRLLTSLQMPALKAFCQIVERFGVYIDEEELTGLQEALDIEHDELVEDLIGEVPAAVKRKHAEKGLKFTRPDFVRDILFTEEGFGLEARVFTKSTQKLPDDQKIPSTSAKDHLPYFDDHPWVEKYMHYSKLQKMRSTYVGREFDEKKNGPTGFFKYLHEGRIHPSFNLHGTVTGRTSSRNPNAQNFPKRGRLAKAFRKVFKPSPGYVFVETDLSQAELRVAAWMAHERTMLSIYDQDGDIHSLTAAAVLGVPIDTFNSWKERGDELLIDIANEIPGSGSVLQAMNPGSRKTFTLGEFVGLQRFRAKAVNFGFLYGMGWRKFRVYAKTDYGLDYTDEEAQSLRDTFFELYPGLAEWHTQMEGFVREHGYVRALHGALRRLPSVFSSEENVQHSSIRQAINSPVQRFASDLGLIALARLVRDCPLDDLRPVLFIHDALILEVKEDRVDELLPAIRFYMESSPLREMFGIVPPIPIKADLSVGPNLADMDELSGIDAEAPEWYQEDLDMAA